MPSILTTTLASLFAMVLTAAAQPGLPDSDPFDRTLLRPRSATAALSAAAGDTTVSITVDKSAFPTIRVYTDILDQYQAPVAGIDPEDLTVTQDNLPVDFELQEVSQLGCPSAICLVIDVSFSMSGEPIAAARDAAHAFVDRMGPYDRAAIVSFSNCVTVNAPFTDNRAALHTAIDQLQPIGLTASFDGIYEGVRLTASQPGDRAVIAFSDGCDNNSATCTYPPDGWSDGYDDDSALICNLANNGAVSVYTLTFGPIESTCLDPMEAFALGTGGSFRHSPTADIIDSVYTAIRESLCRRYVAIYHSPDSVSDFDTHDVAVCLASSGGPICDSMTYTEPAAPVISLSAATADLGDICQTPRSDIRIEALVTDPAAPFVQSVQLLYRAVSSFETPFLTLNMSSAGGGLYAATITGAQWTLSTPGIEYFIAASDGEATVTLPPFTPHTDPFVISFCPNRPPDISGLSVSNGDSLTARVSATITDTLNSVARAAAYFRRIGTTLYDSTEFAALGAGRWSATLPNIIRNVNYELLVRAWDNFGLVSSAGPLPFRCDTIPHDNPHPTDRWIILQCDGPIFGNDTLASGDTIRAWDIDGIVCGRAVAGADGAFGTMLVYGDNPGTPLLDEGPLPGELISFTVNDRELLYTPGLRWTVHLDTFVVCDLLPCRTFDLDPGWHLISWDRAVSLDIDSLVALLGGPSCVDIVLGFDHGAVAYDPDLSEYSTLAQVDYRHAYWVRLECPADFLLCGEPIPSAEFIDIAAGWNLIPYWPSTPLATESAWTSILGSVDVAIGFDHGGLIWRPEDPLHSTLIELSPGLGYWLRANAPGTLLYPGWSAPEKRTTVTITSPPATLAPSRQWLSLYGERPTLDGAVLPDGTVIDAVTPDGVLCGTGIIRDHRLAFTPVYGADESSPAYPAPGAQFVVRVNGLAVLPTLTWTAHSDRILLGALSTSGTANSSLPESFSLGQNFPNPFNPQTTIPFSLPVAAHVRIAVYNILGQEIAVLADSPFPAGSHTVVWNGRDRTGAEVGSGVYLYRLTGDGFTLQRKMLLLK